MRLGLSVALAVALAASLSAAPLTADSSTQAPTNDDCLACHGDTSATRANGTPVFVDQKKIADSTHGPLACVDCHGSHDVRPKTDRASRVFRTSIPATCGKCHAGIEQRYNAGIHAAAAKRGDAHAPMCADCHTAHSIQRADTDAWKLSVTAECGTCHDKVVESYRRTFHGKVTELGFARVAACADCHGAHGILPASNPASMVSAARRVSTCQTCHPNANERFTRYDPHPDPHDYRRSPLLWWINQFYTVLIAGCFSFFGLHSLLWFHRSRRERKREAAHGRDQR